jgi:hypothetical protein
MNFRKRIAVIAASALVMGLIPLGTLAAHANTPVTGAGFTSVNEGVDGTGHCQNGNPNVNCNIYDGKEFVWLNGGPSTAYVGDGDYFFAVLSPGGQADPNDGAPNNLSDDFDAYTNRTFTVSGGSVSYGGSHDFDSNKIRLFNYADTTNPGGVYILAICSLADGYPVDASDCKYDAFKVTPANAPPAQDLTVTKDAKGTNNNTYTWAISKDVDQTLVKQSGGNATFNYTITATHDGGTIGNVKVTGTISVFNPNVDASNSTVAVDISGVTDELSDGTVCDVTNGGAQTLTHIQTDFAYSCNLDALPQGELDNTAAVTWPDQNLDNGATLLGSSADFTFPNISFTENAIDECADVTDTYYGALGTVCVGDPNPSSFTYSRTVDGTPGSCVLYDNTATFTTNDTGATDSASQTVTLCRGADLTVSKTANPTFTRTYRWSIYKSVDQTHFEPSGTAHYTVHVAETGFADSGWKTTGSITVTNPNDWEAVTFTATDAVDNGGTCVVTGGTNVTLAAGVSTTLAYTCTYSSAPSPSSGTNTATASWNAATFFTPSGSATGTAGFNFGAPTTTVNKTIHVTDTYAGALGTLTATDSTPFTSHDFTYTRTFTPPNGCQTFNNTATITETGQTSSASVTVCNTGALTMGFWQNKNGQSIVTGQAKTGVCPSTAWLRQYAPFQDLSATSTCAQVGTYVTNVIKAANASGASMNAMLKAQMLATALDVYFSDPALGGNKISAPVPVGGVAIDLTKICKMIDGSGGTATCSGVYQNASSAFGGATSLTVSQILSYASSQSNVGGSVWYGQVKATQELAKNTFDAINNQVAFGP